MVEGTSDLDFKKNSEAALSDEMRGEVWSQTVLLFLSVSFPFLFLSCVSFLFLFFSFLFLSFALLFFSVLSFSCPFFSFRFFDCLLFFSFLFL